MSILNTIKNVSANLAKPATIAVGLLAASTQLAEATTLIYAFTGQTCYRAPITVGRDKPYDFRVNDARIVGRISSVHGKPSWQDGFNVVANVTAAFYTEGRAHGVTGTYANMHGCDGSWAPYCGTVAATSKEGSLPRNWQFLVDNDACIPSGTIKRMWEYIVRGETAQSLGLVGKPVVTTQVPVTPSVPVNQNNQTVTTGTRVEQSCTVDNQGCVHVELKFDF